MKLPASSELFAFYQDLTAKCASSRDERKRLYNYLRMFFLYGCGPEGGEHIINKIYPHVEQVNALVYSSETTRFSIDLAPTASDLAKAQVGPLMRFLNNEWHLSNTDLVFSEASLWAHCYGSMFVKTRVNAGQIETFLVEPHDMGVLREDISGLWRQEAFTHSYYVTESQFEYELRQIPHPRLESILKAITPRPRSTELDTSMVMDRIVTSQSTPNMIGNVNIDLGINNKYKPQVAEELLRMTELYVFDDDLGDYRIVTLAEPGIVVFDRALSSLFLKNEQPFVQVCPNPAYDYFWGYSVVDRLVPLQKMRNERMEQIIHMLNLQARPPKFGSGFQGSIDEIADTLDSPSGVISADLPGARMETISPQIPEDLYKEIREIDGMFEEMTGITNVMSGRGESGVRSQGHAANLARLGSARAKKRALTIEDQLEKLANLFLMLIKEYKPDRMRADPVENQKDGLEFIAEQFTDKFIVKVDAHSNSPIFMEDQRQLAFELLKAKAIDRQSLLDLLDVPMKELLKLRLTKMEVAEAQAQQRQAAIEAQSGGKVRHLKGAK
jgi:hypothetical protein